MEAPVSGAGDRQRVLIGAALAVLVALGLYAVVGEAGYEDQPYARRVAEWARTPETLDAPRLAAVMGEAARTRPDDRQALTLLGAARFEAGDPIGAASAFRRALALDPDDAVSWARLGESLVRAAQGRIDGDAEAAFREAVQRDPNQLGARYFLGELALTRGDAAEVRAMWGPLIAVLDPADPRRADLIARPPPSVGRGRRRARPVVGDRSRETGVANQHTDRLVVGVRAHGSEQLRDSAPRRVVVEHAQVWKAQTRVGGVQKGRGRGGLGLADATRLGGVELRRAAFAGGGGRNYDHVA
eukprot:gene47694-63957_t